MLGAANGRAKLNEDLVRKIRHLYRTRQISQVVLASRYGVSAVAINHVIHGRTWKHVGAKS